MVRIKGGIPLRLQQHGLDTATKGLTDSLLPCFWFCCSCFHKLGTEASAFQSSDILCQLSLWNRREFRWETSLVVDYLPLLAGSFTSLPLEWDLYQLWWIIIKIFIGRFDWLSIQYSATFYFYQGLFAVSSSVLLVMYFWFSRGRGLNARKPQQKAIV